MNKRIEALAQKLGILYGSYGYESYAMQKFEAYELYLRNKDFLLSDRVLTFTDTDGKLMALKPDVTLSIIKNTRDIPGVAAKMYYRETVYRPGNSGFREIMQVGLECMGQVDDYCIFEVLLLAIKSLRAISKRCVLDISHMGLLTGLMDRIGLEEAARGEVMEAIGSKNAHTVRSLCEEAGVSADALSRLAKLGGRMEQVLPVLQEIFGDAPELDQLKRLLSALAAAGCGDCVNVDFSVVNDMRYYNGIVFRGFVEGVPGGVLSGGQYDALMAKMNRRGKAIGFAVYPDLLERLEAAPAEEPVDAVLYYGPECDLTVLSGAVEELTGRGMSVKVLPEGTVCCECKTVYRMIGNEVREDA